MDIPIIVFVIAMLLGHFLGWLGGYFYFTANGSETINADLLEACEWAYGELEERDCSREDVLEVLAKAIRKVEETQ